MTLYLDQLQQQMDKTDFSESCCNAAYGVILKQLQAFTDSRFTMEYDHDSQLTSKRFASHTGFEVDAFRDTLLQLTGNVKKFIEARAHLQQSSDTVIVERTTNDSSERLSTPVLDTAHQQDKVQLSSLESQAKEYSKEGVQ